MMKKLLTLVLALCMVLCIAVCAQGEERRVPECKNPEHWIGDGLDHNRPQACWITGHNYCDGKDHVRAACGVWAHYNCDDREHLLAPCGLEGHYECKGDHGAAVCGIEGHYACEKGHTTAVNKYCTAEPQHKKCEKNAEHYCDPAQGGCGVTYLCTDSNKHTTCEMCGLLWCDNSTGGHYTPCGNRNHRPCVYAQQGKAWRSSDHPKCHLCGGGKCTGPHGVGTCVAACSQCGKALDEGETHRARCGKHYTCISKGLDHGWCKTCGKLKCSSSHSSH